MESPTIVLKLKDRLDMFWSNVLYDYEADFHGIGNRSILMQLFRVL